MAKYELPNGRQFNTDAELNAYISGMKDATRNVVALIGDSLREQAKNYVDGDAKVYGGLIEAEAAKEAASKKEAASEK